MNRGGRHGRPGFIVAMMDPPVTAGHSSMWGMMQMNLSGEFPVFRNW